MDKTASRVSEEHVYMRVHWPRRGAAEVVGGELYGELA